VDNFSLFSNGFPLDLVGRARYHSNTRSIRVGGVTVQQVLTAITTEATVDPHQLCDEQIIADLEAAFEIRRRNDARILTLLQVANARELTATLRGRTPKGWLIESQRLSAKEAGRLVKLSRHLPFRPQLADALAAGEISLDHAAPILTTVNKLNLNDQDLDEKILIEAARELDPDAIRSLCHKTLEAACADEQTEARRERVYGSRYLTLSETFDGMVKLDAMLTPEQGAALSAVIEPLAQTLGADDNRSAPKRRADALATLAQAALGFDDLLPEFNGEQPHINAVMHYDPLVDALRPYADTPVTDDGGFTINGTQVSPQTARMLACDAQIIPVVMRGDSEVLDIGRATRT
jgi:hypothetical protein